MTQTLLTRIFTRTLMALALALQFGCGDDQTTTEPPKNNGEPTFAEQSRSEQLSQLKAKIGTNVVIGREMGYEQEFAVNRVLRILDRRAESVRKLTSSISELTISNSFGTSNQNNVFRVSISIYGTEPGILEYIEKATLERELPQVFGELATRLGIASILDGTGMKVDEAKAFAERMRTGASGIEFPTEDKVTVYVADLFAISDSILLIKASAAPEELRAFFEKAVALLKIVPPALEEVSKKTNLRVAVQPGILSLEEFEAAVQMATANAQTFIDSAVRVQTIYIGRRFETDKDKKKSSSVALIPFNATREQILENFADYPLDWSKLNLRVVDAMKAYYRTGSVNVDADASRFGADQRSNEALTVLVRTLMAALPVEKTPGLVTLIRLDRSGYTSLNQSGYLNVSASDFTLELLKGETDKLVKTREVSSYYGNEGISFSIPYSSLDRGHEGFETINTLAYALYSSAAPARLKALNTKAIVVQNIHGANYSGAALTVGFDASGAQIGAALKEEEDRRAPPSPSPEPSPSPSPSPSPEPEEPVSTSGFGF